MLTPLTIKYRYRIDLIELKCFLRNHQFHRPLPRMLSQAFDFYTVTYTHSITHRRIHTFTNTQSLASNFRNVGRN